MGARKAELGGADRSSNRRPIHKLLGGAYRSPASMETGLVGQFWGLDSDRILKLVLEKSYSPKRFRCPQAAADHSRLPGEGRHYAAAAPASVQPSDADLLDVQRSHRRTDSADFRPRPTPVTRIGR